MKKTYYILVLLLFIFFGCVKKSADIDMVKLSKDSLAVYLDLANEISLPFNKKQQYNQKAFAIIINQSNDSLNRVNLFKVANRYYNMNDRKGFGKMVNIVLEKSQSANDTVNIAKAFTYLGDYYSSLSISDTAFMYYFKAEKMYIRLGDNYNVARTRLNKANLQYSGSDFSGSEISVFNALRAIKNDQKNYIVYESYNLLGILYNELGEFDKALEYHEKALSSIDDKLIPIDFQSRATSLNNIGYVYQNLDRHKQAKQYFQEGLKQKDLIKYKLFVYAMLLDNLAYSKFKLNESDGIPQLFYESLKLRDSLHSTVGIILSQIHLSEYFASKNDTIKSLQYSKEALATAISSKNYRNALAPLKRLAIIDPKRASVYTKQYIHINDSLQKADRKMGEKFTRIEYETDQIKDQNSTLTDQNRNLLYGFSFFMILGLFFYIIKAQKTKNRELLFKHEQQKANEDIYNLMISQQNTIETSRVKEKKRVAQELHDGVLGRMFGVRINLDSLNKFQDDKAIEQRISYLNELKNIEQDIREISHDLNREKSELINNFVAIVDKLIEEQKKSFQSKLVTAIDSSIKWEKVSNSVKIDLYRILQESLQNINKYAKANLIKVEFKKVDDLISLSIADDGIGFNVARKAKGIGLQNMVSRVKECEGTFDLKSKIGEGTTIIVTVPTEQKNLV